MVHEATDSRPAPRWVSLYQLTWGRKTPVNADKHLKGVVWVVVRSLEGTCVVGLSGSGINLRKRRLRVVKRPDPETLTTFWSYFEISTTVPALSHLRG